MTGLRFGRLVVIGRAPDKIDENSGKHKSQWYCDCDCGTKGKIILGAALTSGTTRSCGCLHRDVASETAKTKISHGRKYNEYDLSKNFGIGYTTKGEEFYFDLEDYEKIKEYCWHINNRGYVIAYDIFSNEKASVRQHRLINEPNDWQVVDHINGCKNDNRKKNLRNVRQTYNARNKATPINNTSGHVGVSKCRKKWVARIGVDGKTIHLGYFDTFIEAVDAREEAEKMYFEEFRRESN